MLEKVLTALSVFLGALATWFYVSSKSAEAKAEKYRQEKDQAMRANESASTTIKQQRQQDDIDQDIDGLGPSDISSRLRKYARGNNKD